MERNILWNKMYIRSYNESKCGEQVYKSSTRYGKGEETKIWGGAIECLSGYPGLHHKSLFQKETMTRISNSIS